MKRRRRGALCRGAWARGVWLSVMAAACTGADRDAGGDEVAMTVAGGQSGNEGSGDRTPCFADDEAWVIRGRVVEAEGGCLTLDDLELLNAAARGSFLQPSGRAWGAYRLWFSDEDLEAGDEALALYAPGPNGAQDASLEAIRLDGDGLTILWRGGRYESSLQELGSEGCEALFRARSPVEDGGSAASPRSWPTPLACEEAP